MKGPGEAGKHLWSAPSGPRRGGPQAHAPGMAAISCRTPRAIATASSRRRLPLRSPPDKLQRAASREARSKSLNERTRQEGRGDELPGVTGLCVACAFSGVDIIAGFMEEIVGRSCYRVTGIPLEGKFRGRASKRSGTPDSNASLRADPGAVPSMRLHGGLTIWARALNGGQGVRHSALDGKAFVVLRTPAGQ